MNRTGPCTEVLLCDADGNLFPSEEPAFVASAVITNAFLAAHAVPVRLDPEQLRLTTTGKNFRTTAVDLAVAYGVPLSPELAVRHPGAVTAPEGEGLLTAGALEHWVLEEKREVTRYLGEVLRPDPAVIGPVTRLLQRYRSAVVSSSASSRLDACFRASGLAPLFPESVRYSAEDSLPVPTSKPDPAVYLFACERLGVDPARALAVEDSVPGARSAVAAGVPTLGNVAFVPPAERSERVAQLRAVGVLEVVSSWTELEHLLARDDSPLAACVPAA